MSAMGTTIASDGAEVQTAPSRFIVPLSGSYHGMRAVPHVTDLARRFEAGLSLVTVPNDLDYDRVTEVPGWLQVLRDRVDLERVDLVVTEPGDPARTILEVLDGTDGAALCIATHARRGASELVHHHVARSVLRRAKAPAWVVGRDCSRHPRTGPIIVCHDGTDRSDAIVATAGRWGFGLGVGFRLVHMVEALDSDSKPTPAVSRATALLGRKTEVIAMRSAFHVSALVQLAANAGASAIAVALPPETGHDQGPGHLASNLIRESTCPVLTARASS